MIATAIVGTSCFAAPPQYSRCPTTEELKSYTGIFPIRDYGEVQLVNGKGRSDEVPEGGAWNFDHKIASTQLMRPEHGVSFWLMNISSMHLLGTGAWDTLHFVSCKNGHLHVIPQDRFLYGAKVDVISDREFTTRSGYWLKKDARCCPSKVEIRRYRWNAERRTFLVTQREINAK